MEPQTRTFNLTTAQLAEVRAVLKDKYGIAIVGFDGDVNKGGFVASYSIDFDKDQQEVTADKLSLTITLTALPILVTSDNAWGVIVGTVNASIKKFNG